MISTLALALIAFVTLVFLGLVAIDLYGALRKEPGEAYLNRRFRPRTLVIVPCKGLDVGLRENLISMKSQGYDNFEMVAVIDSKADEAAGVLKKAGIRYMISRSACGRCSGKVRAISTAIEKFRDYDVYVIADSDIRVGANWLGAIIAPLAERKTGLSTMYPYFNHIGGFWSKVKSVWAMVGEGLMRREMTKFGWGGSLAFRKELLDRKSFRFLKNSRYSVSDDICLTMIARKKGMAIAYTDLAQPVVNTRDSLAQFWEWANRQTALSIMGNRKNLYIGLPFYFAESLCILSGITLSILVSPVFLVLLLHTFRNSVIILKRSRQKDLLIILIVFLVPFLYLANLIVASRMREIRWRGSTYALP